MFKIGLIGTLFILTGCMPGGSELVVVERAPAGSTNGALDRAKSVAAFKSTVYPILKGQTCVKCHSSGSRGQSPVFADDNVEKAYDALTLSKKVDLLSPESSRIVVKLKDQSHNCWSSNCVTDSEEMLAAVKKWVTLIPTADNGPGFFTDALPVPADTSALPAQTEHGTLLLQAEQSLYLKEVQEGRFIEEQNSAALDGKYLTLPEPDRNPHTVAGRTLEINRSAFDSCREFTQADLAQSTRVMRFFEQKVHIPSGLTTDAGKPVNDGYRPFASKIGMSIIRPDRRLEYAKMIVNNDFSNLGNVVIYTGAATTPPVREPGERMPDSMLGTPFSVNSTVSILPYFTDPKTVYNSDGSFVQNGTYTKDDGSVESLYTLFKEGSYLPSQSMLHKKLLKHSNYKKNFLYKNYKDVIRNWFYYGTTKREPSKYVYAYNNQTYDIDMVDYFLPKVRIELKCPNEPVNPALPYNSSTNPMKDCTTNKALLRFHVVEETGANLVQANALDCYTLNSTQTDFMKVDAGLCNGSSNKYFHYMDLFVNYSISEATVFGPINLVAVNSTTPTSYVDNEVYTNNTAGSLSFNPSLTDRVELDPEAFFAGGEQKVSEGEDLINFTNTLHKTLRTTRCVDCHGDGNPALPQFASPSPSSALNALGAGGLIDFANPSKSFRPNGMIHNCNPASSDPRYSCSDAAETKLRESLIAGINAWKTANQNTAAQEGVKNFREMTRDERLPGRVKYKFKVTSSGLHNVWFKVKNSPGSFLNFRILTSSGSPVNYTVGTNTSSAGNCYRWSIDTGADQWLWGSPGRNSELPRIDQKGYLLLDDNKQPLSLPNSRIYFNLVAGEYILDVIGLSPGLKLDAVGVNKVNDFSVDSRLDFQPDRRAVDEKNISDYKRKVLSYDLSKLLNLPSDKKAFFHIEVRKEFNGQNYIFRNPRFEAIPRDFNISVKAMRVLINGKHSYPDATYNSFEGIVGDNQVLTYAPLVALTGSGNDMISFKFDHLSTTPNALTALFPKGTPPASIEDRRCNDLDFFIKNVKPILKDAKVMLTADMLSLYGSFPGGPKTATSEPESYKCISCHTSSHPYFKMSTFANNEEFCREALSRVDFQNFYQSLVIRGINGTGNHPKFVFFEKFITGSDGNFKLHDDGQDYMDGRHKVTTSDGRVVAAKSFPGPRLFWTKEELGVPGTSWAQLTTTQKNMAKYIGRFKKLKHHYVDMNVTGYVWFIPEVHTPLLTDRVNINLISNRLSVMDVIHPDPLIGKLHKDRNNAPLVYSIEHMVNGVPAVANIGEDNSAIPFKADFKVWTPNAEPGINRDTIDYMSETPQKESLEVMLAEQEILRDYYREKVIEWIRRENAARLKQGN